MQNCSFRSAIQFSENDKTCLRWEVFQSERPLQAIMKGAMEFPSTLAITVFLNQLSRFLNSIETGDHSRVQVCMSSLLWMDVTLKNQLRFQSLQDSIPLEIFIDLNDDVYSGLKQMFANLAPYEV